MMNYKELFQKSVLNQMEAINLFCYIYCNVTKDANYKDFEAMIIDSAKEVWKQKNDKKDV